MEHSVYRMQVTIAGWLGQCLLETRLQLHQTPPPTPLHICSASPKNWTIQRAGPRTATSPWSEFRSSSGWHVRSTRNCCVRQSGPWEKSGRNNSADLTKLLRQYSSTAGRRNCQSPHRCAEPASSSSSTYHHGVMVRDLAGPGYYLDRWLFAGSPSVDSAFYPP